MGKWEEKELKEVAEIVTGSTPKTSNSEFYSNGTIPFVKPPDLGSVKPIINSITKVTQKAIEVSRPVPKDSILVCCIGSLGKFGIAGCDLITNQQINTIIFDKNIIIPKFGFYYAYTLEKKLNDIANHALVQIVNKTNFSKIEISFPKSLPEQQRIVTKLDGLFAKIDQAMALLEENIAHTKALMGSVLDAEFGRLEKGSIKKEKLKNLTTKIGSGSTPRGGQSSYKESGISLIRSMNVHDCYFKDKNLAFIDDEQAYKLKNVEIQENDVLLNITGASVARCCIVDSNYLPARVNQHVSIIRTDETVLPEFMLYYLISPKMKSKLLYDSSGNATREAITKSMIEAIEVPVLSTEIQLNLIKKIKKSFRLNIQLIESQTQKLTHLKALKSSLLDQAFKGAL